jgi:hypothetical protein
MTTATKKFRAQKKFYPTKISRPRRKNFTR